MSDMRQDDYEKRRLESEIQNLKEQLSRQVSNRIDWLTRESEAIYRRIDDARFRPFRILSLLVGALALPIFFARASVDLGALLHLTVNLMAAWLVVVLLPYAFVLYFLIQDSHVVRRELSNHLNFLYRRNSGKYGQLIQRISEFQPMFTFALAYCGIATLWIYQSSAKEHLAKIIGQQNAQNVATVDSKLDTLMTRISELSDKIDANTATASQRMESIQSQNQEIRVSVDQVGQTVARNLSTTGMLQILNEGLTLFKSGGEEASGLRKLVAEVGLEFAKSIGKKSGEGLFDLIAGLFKGEKSPLVLHHEVKLSGSADLKLTAPPAKNPSVAEATIVPAETNVHLSQLINQQVSVGDELAELIKVLIESNAKKSGSNGTSNPPTTVVSTPPVLYNANVKPCRSHVRLRR